MEIFSIPVWRWNAGRRIPSKKSVKYKERRSDQTKNRYNSIELIKRPITHKIEDKGVVATKINWDSRSTRWRKATLERKIGAKLCRNSKKMMAYPKPTLQQYGSSLMQNGNIEPISTAISFPNVMIASTSNARSDGSES